MKRGVIILLLILAVLILFILNLALGSVSIPLEEVVKTLVGNESSKQAWHSIILRLRLPKALTAIMAGIGLSVSGLQMQTLFRNPLAGPFVLGVSSGASLGVALLTLASGITGLAFIQHSGIAGTLGLVLSAGLGAFSVLLLIIYMMRRVRDNVTLLIIGLMLGYFAGALVSVLMYYSSSEQVRDFVVWSFGSFGRVSTDQLYILIFLVVVGVAIASLFTKSMNALLLGDNYARSLGVPLQKVRYWMIISTGILAGGITAFCGPIAFIGIAVPHLGRMLLNSSDHRILIPVSALIGAGLALLCNIFAQFPGSELIFPINAITAFIGAPVVILVILKMKKLRTAF